MHSNALQGCKVLILEDDYYQASDYRSYLKNLGAEIILMTGDLKSLPADLKGKVDVALLDVNIRGATSYDFARTLQRQAVPFMFVTGYERNQLPADLASAPILIKPIEIAELVSSIEALRWGTFRDTASD